MATLITMQSPLTSQSNAVRSVFIAGATGYMGSRLASLLLARGHRVAGLVRPGSEARLATGCRAVPGNALDSATFRNQLHDADTYVQLVGVAHPSPSKARQFREIDLKSCEESLKAVSTSVRHFIYVSVAHPAPMMHAYIEVRTRCEEMIRQRGVNATILRPWYVLGPGHYWPYLLKPAYALARQIPSLRDGAERLALVTIDQMLATLVDSVEHPASGFRIVEVPEIIRGTFASSTVSLA
jgi:uncharacterized protein YbjT (DUF2867 family)